MPDPDTPRPVSIPAEIAHLTPLRGRTPSTTDEERADAFAELTPYRDGGVYIGHWGEGGSEWERHPADEIVAVVDGETTIILLLGGEEVSHSLGPAGLIVVPANTWHRFETPGMVKIITVTPQPGDHQADRPEPTS
jgi:mannose-6-phosphate isomerase-like protein (cupin superfamily)